MRLTRPLAVTLSTALLGIPGVVVLASPASAIVSSTYVAAATYQTTTTMHVNRPRALYGRIVTIRGQVLIRRGGKPYWVGNRKVHLQRRLAGEQRFRTVDTATTPSTPSSHGVYTFHTIAWRNGTYRVLHTGNSTFGRSARTSTVYTFRRVPVRLTEPRTNVFFMRGNVNPGWNRSRLYLQRKTCGRCSWRTWKAQTTTGTGGFRFRLSTPGSGSHYFRVVVPRNGRYLRSVSATGRVYVT